PAYDLLLTGGHVIDPRNNIAQISDLAVQGGRIARVAAVIPAAQARRVVDVAGLYVIPGLVDIHIHAFAGGPGRIGRHSVFPDGFTFRAGVTTVVDAGTSGWRNFDDFKRLVIDRARTRVLAMLHIAGGGANGANEQDPADMDPEATAKTARQYPELIVGIKTAHYAGRDWLAVDSSVKAAALAGLPVTVDFGTNRPERPLRELLLSKLRPGDIYTHVYSGLRGELGADGKVNPALWEARKRGVIFDLGHGGGSFFWRIAVPAMREGFLPDSVSTDLHNESMNAGVKDMLHVMSKMLALGVPLGELVRMATSNPARQIRRPQLGHLGVGAGADVAVLRVEEGRFGLVDSGNSRRMAARRLVCELTLRDGRVVWDLNARAADDWESPRK
ncbi:MAG: amidohydrolase/deacetylase family metallohydrolase, partial [Bryobacteraceae bacterium]